MTASIQLLETPDEIEPVEALQRIIWPGSETEIVPLHMLITAAHNGGLILGTFEENELMGFVFGFPGLHQQGGELQPKHCSHMLGVHPDYRDRGLGFHLKRAQWQMVRHQGIALITWTYDPLLSRNAYLNIAKLGGICNTYLEKFYGDMRDELNAGLPSDRLKVELWVSSPRVKKRLDRHPRRRLDLAHYLGAGAQLINPTGALEDGLPLPASTQASLKNISGNHPPARMLILEIPSDYQAMRTTAPDLALHWRTHVRALFTQLFDAGYLVSDFVFLRGSPSRSFYILSYGESTLGG
jgi:predicted GNAT superfamily acetyltransferase